MELDIIGLIAYAERQIEAKLGESREPGRIGDMIERRLERALDGLIAAQLALGQAHELQHGAKA